MKGLIKLSVGRPVTIFMIMVIFIILGFVSLPKFEMSFLPDIEFPMMMIMTPYYGASAEEIEELVTTPLERALTTVNGITDIESKSTENFSMITLKFKWGTDIDTAFLDVSEKVDLAKMYLPRNVKPSIFKFSPELMPIMILMISGNTDVGELTEIAEDLRMEIERLPSISYVLTVGARPKEIQVMVDYKKLISRGIGISMIQNAILGSNLRLPGGMIEEPGRYHPVFIDEKLKDLEDLGMITLEKGTGFGMMGMMSGMMSSFNIGSLFGMGKSAVRLKDVAEIKVGNKLTGSFAYLNRKPSIALVIQKRSGKNVISACKEVKDFLKNEVRFKNIDLTVAMDQSEYMENSINTLLRNLMVGGIVAIIVLGLFLRTFRVVFVVGLTIPLSLLVGTILMYFSRMSMNIMSLGGLALAIGMLVDSAIVVTESIYRHIEDGEEPSVASINGAGEVGGAITASTLTTIAVFFPVIFTRGLAAKLFTDLALAVTYTLLASLFISLTFVPSASQFVIRKEKVGMRWLREPYKKGLTWVLRHKISTVTIVIVMFLLSIFLLFKLGFSLFPTSTPSNFRIMFSLKPGTTTDRTGKVVREIEDYLMKNKDTFGIEFTYSNYGKDEDSPLQGIMGDVGYESGYVGCGLRTDGSAMNFDKLKKKVEDELFARLKEKYPDIKLEFFNPTTQESEVFGKPIEIEIRGNDDTVLEEISGKVMKRISKLEFIRNLSASAMKKMEKIVVKPIPEKMKVAKLSPYQLSAELSAINGRQYAGDMYYEGEILNISVYPTNTSGITIENLKIPNLFGGKFELSKVATVIREFKPIEINHRDTHKVALITMDVEGVSLSEAQKKIEREVSKLDLPKGYSIEVKGQTLEMVRTMKDLGFALLLGIVLMYMIMAAEFESLIQPFVIMLTVPMGLIGVSLALWLAGMDVTVVAMVGIITLAGIVVNNGIVMVDYINQLRRRGMKKEDAIIEGAATRLRPVLMTSLTTIIALLPDLILKGEGREMHVPMALVVIGGLTAATFLTLFFEPVFYSILDRFSRRKWDERSVIE